MSGYSHSGTTEEIVADQLNVLNRHEYKHSWKKINQVPRYLLPTWCCDCCTPWSWGCDKQRSFIGRATLITDARLLLRMADMDMAVMV